MRHFYVLYAALALLAGACVLSLIQVQGSAGRASDALAQIQSVQRHIQHVQSHQNDGLHSVICFSENFISHDRKLTAAQKTQDLKIYDHMLAVAHLAPCET